MPILIPASDGRTAASYVQSDCCHTDNANSRKEVVRDSTQSYCSLYRAGVSIRCVHRGAPYARSIARVCVTMHRDASLRRAFGSAIPTSDRFLGVPVEDSVYTLAESDPRSHSVASEPRCCHIWPGTLVSRAVKVPCPQVANGQASFRRTDTTRKRTIDSGQETRCKVLSPLELPVRETPLFLKGLPADPSGKSDRRKGCLRRAACLPRPTVRSPGTPAP
jgi:hypothetical protein